MKSAASPAGSGSDLPLRVASAIVLIVLVSWVTWIGGSVFAWFWALVSALVYFEYQRICCSGLSRGLGYCGAGLLLVAILATLLLDSFGGVILATGGAVALFGWEMVSRRSAWVAVGLLYAFLPFLALTELRGDWPIGLVAICLVFACVWGADTFAYFSGRAIGGPKLAPSISPNKTWSGFVGGLAGSVVLATIVVLVAGDEPGPWLLPAALVLSLVSQMGDLFESWIKRRFKVKDSGHVIPGHGGVLDRIDGLIFASFVAFAIGYCLAQINAGHNDRVPGDYWTQNFVAAFTMP